MPYDLDEDDSIADSKDGEFQPRDLGNSGSCDNDANMSETPETIFEMDKPINDTQADEPTGMKENQSEDPFNIYPLLNKQKVSNGIEETSVQTPKFPPGFTPSVNENNVHVDPSLSKEDPIKDTSESVCSGHFKKSAASRSQGSILNLMEELIKVGQTMGYNMDGCLYNLTQIIESQGEAAVDFLALQETKMESIDLFNIRSCWGNLRFDHVHSDSVGNSGGILCVWDPYSLCKINSTVSEYFVMIRGVWLKTGNNILIILVYAPHDLKEKHILWDYLNHVIQSWNGEVVIMGDSNEVRLKSDRFGSVFNAQGANTFNSFIAKARLEEVPLGGSSFTWCHKSATKMSQLDRFLISENLLISCPNITAITLDRYLSDHRPILLRESWFDYGPIPFRFYHDWIEIDGFSNFVEHTWNETSGNGIKKKLNNTRSGKAKFKEDLKFLDAEIDNGDGFAEKVLKRAEVINSIQDIDKLHSMELAQKAKINWCVEGDENSHFFHGMLNKRRSQMSIRGIMIDGVWIEDPYKVKSEFFDHFSSRFAKPVTKEEFKKAVWDCGTDKSTGPDGYTFGFFRRFWSTIEDDIFEAVKYFFSSEDIPKGCNSSFIVLIPKIPIANLVKDCRPISLIGSIYKIITKILANRLVGVLGDIINELKKKHSLIFKVDFEKAFDSIRWDFLDAVLKNFGFGVKWCNWIQSCLSSSRGSILVNGSPTKEFDFHKGLKQGDPLSPFLFILVMESLHLSFQRVVDAGMYKGVQLNSSLSLSHMFYTDDAIFMGEWCDNNINILTLVLDCFHRASGLKINMSKSKIMGSKVGGSMSRYQAWEEVIDKVWKFHCHSYSLWTKVMKAIHGEDGKIDAQFTELLDLMQAVTLSPISDRWTWTLEGSGDFTVASIRSKIDSIRLSSISSATKWIKSVPIKVNVLLWKVKLDALPTRLNISRRGMPIDSIVCPICDHGVKSSSHLFFSRTLATQLACKISLWWNISYAEVNSFQDWQSWITSLRRSLKHKSILKELEASSFQVRENDEEKIRDRAVEVIFSTV
nr:putative RNA-directed DNA polymerase, eukaryota, reverse transcriptase zinc-binding domain protein [Tanacetum cinerariifolium]